MTGQLGAGALASKSEPGVMSLESLSPIEDIQVTLSVELDRRLISVHELLQLELGHVIKFARPVGQDVDLYAGDVLLGSAEILVFDGQLAARVADLRDNSKAGAKSDGVTGVKG